VTISFSKELCSTEFGPMNPFRHFGRTPWTGGSVYRGVSTYTG